LGLRFRAPKRFALLSEYTDSEHIALGFQSDDGGVYEEAIDVYRYHVCSNEPVPTWHTDIDALAAAQEWQELELQPPITCSAGGYAGELSTFRCLVPRLDKQIAGAVWTATLACDHVAVCYRCAMKRERMLGEMMADFLESLAILRRPSPDPVPVIVPTSLLVPPGPPVRPARPRSRRLRSAPWRNIGMIVLLAPVFVLASLLGVRDGKRMAEVENSYSAIALPQESGQSQTGTPVEIGAEYVGNSIVTLSTPGINFALPSTISTMDTSDSPNCARFVGRTARLVVCNRQQGNSLFEDWDSVRRAVVLTIARGDLSDVVEAPHSFSTYEGITGVEGIIRYTAESDGAAIEQWQMIGMTPRGEEFSIYYLTGPDHPLDASPLSADHLIRDTITPNRRI
jgi:hypothetical protein